VRVLTSANGAARAGSERDIADPDEVRFAARRFPTRRFAEARDFARELERQIQSFRPDVVHAQHMLSALGALGPCAGAAVPLAVTVRDHWPVCFWSTRISRGALCPACSVKNMTACVRGRIPALAGLLAIPYMLHDLGARRAALQRAQGVIAVSEAVRSELGTAGIESVAIPNIVDGDELARVSAGAPGLDLPDRFLLFVGKLEANKGASLLVPALRRASVSLPLIVLGSGSLEAQIRSEATAAGLDVRLPGWVNRSDVLRAMKRADALVFPSTWPEPLSRVLIEAIALQVPVAAMDTGGTREILEHEISGLIAVDASTLGAAVQRLVKNPELRARLRAGARSRAHTFSPENLVPRYLSFYRGLEAA
jgi:glycosyltransferase involved in cell wall biosynthesis